MALKWAKSLFLIKMGIFVKYHYLPLSYPLSAIFRVFTRPYKEKNALFIPYNDIFITIPLPSLVLGSTFEMHTFFTLLVF